MGLDDKYNNFVPLNAPFTINDFERELKLLTDAGYTVVGISHYYIEDTFIFPTSKEANKAGHQFEDIEKQIEGWWYGKEEFLKELETTKIPPEKIIWLDNQ